MPDHQTTKDKARNPQRVVIFTGGHHTSALEVARILKTKNWKIIWLGHKFSMWGDTVPSAEYREVTESGIDFIELKAGKLYNTYHPAKLARVPYGFFQAAKIVSSLSRQYGKNLKGIVTFGGYLGVPVVFAGQLFGLPVISHEQTMSTGLANKFISLFAKKVALAWDHSAPISHEKFFYAGLPIRKEMAEIMEKKPQKKKLIYVTGGKQGSHVINQCIFATLPKLLDEYTIVHQTGSSSVFNDYDAAISIWENLPKAMQSKYQVHKYLAAEKAVASLAEAEIVISRSGAHTVYELGLLGTKSILVPIPWSSGQEQLKNAQVLESNHQAIILPQSELTPDNLLSAIEKTKSLNPKPLKLPLDATDRMVQLIEQQL